MSDSKKTETTGRLVPGQKLSRKASSKYPAIEAVVEADGKSVKIVEPAKWVGVYSSISKAGEAITGKPTNGYAFFGLAVAEGKPRGAKKAKEDMKTLVRQGIEEVFAPLKETETKAYEALLGAYDKLIHKLPRAEGEFRVGDTVVTEGGVKFKVIALTPNGVSVEIPNVGKLDLLGSSVKLVGK